MKPKITIIDNVRKQPINYPNDKIKLIINNTPMIRTNTHGIVYFTKEPWITLGNCFVIENPIHDEENGLTIRLLEKDENILKFRRNLFFDHRLIDNTWSICMEKTSDTYFQFMRRSLYSLYSSRTSSNLASILTESNNPPTFIKEIKRRISVSDFDPNLTEDQLNVIKKILICKNYALIQGPYCTG